MQKDLQFIIYAPRYRSASGGAIVTHKLCDTLNSLGYRASLWPLWKPRSAAPRSTHESWRTLTYLGSRMVRGSYRRNPGYNTPLAKTADIDKSIVVYPEIVSGNPLRAPRYVRWLLHEPGFHEGTFSHAVGDLYFCYQEAFNKNCTDMIYGGPLTIADTFLDIYRDVNPDTREKVCHMVRKGAHREDLPDLSDQWVVDGYSHHDLARAFNQCKICYFYDPYTAYAAYAAACGCVPVIVPLPGVSRQSWVPEESGRYGLAYGESDILHAVETRSLMLDQLRSVAQRNVESAQRFALVVKEHFELP